MVFCYNSLSNQETKQMKKLPKIGQRVVVKNYDMGDMEDIVGQKGTVVSADEDYGDLDVVVAFDTIFSTDLHTAGDRSKLSNCWWVSRTNLKKVK